MGHAELVHVADLSKPCNEVYYMYFPMHAVHKETSSTSKVGVVFDESAITASGTSLNDHLLVGPTVHPTISICYYTPASHRPEGVVLVNRILHEQGCNDKFISC